MLKKWIETVLILCLIYPVFITPVIGTGQTEYIVFIPLTIISSIALGIMGSGAFTAAVFFTLTHVLRPLCFDFVEIIGVEFAGSFYLPSILAFLLLILIFSKFRKRISWWQLDKINKVSWLYIASLSIVSGLALVLWAKYSGADLSGFKNSMPDQPLGLLIVYGFLFALFNSIAEELLSRGMLYDGIQSIFKHTGITIISQAIIFSIFHYYGFPGGVSGIIMVFLWSLILGIIRYRTRGLGGVLIAHFMADFTIYIILLSLVSNN